MGIDEYLEGIKEDVKALDDEEIKNVRDRVAMTEKIVVAQDKKIEELEEKIEMLEQEIEQLDNGSDFKWK